MKTAPTRASRIIDMFTSGDDLSEKVVRNFQTWLVNGENSEEKDDALRGLWDKVCDDHIAVPVKQETSEERDEMREGILASVDDLKARFEHDKLRGKRQSSLVGLNSHTKQ